ncbi:hypothetical protein LR48_Vigan07g001600 [Vigna angularis]|uniref:Uncharacterized protein n=1 Tax=Phaseolus angularis TaxID=3914 RepID=A0A0L9UUP5_PHAAN|nr:hypothetical protein LR48_Vigan07g001600 [Vigna angularis]
MNFDSRKDASDQLMEALKDDGVTMIGLYGMGGCGKTTLAMEVKKIAQAEHLFDTVIFVLVSSTVEVSRIQDKIASSLQYPFPESQEMERAQRLCMRLTEKKKILMILDDVWEPLDFGRIGIPLSEYHKGRKILITTRSEEVCISMDCQKKIYLPILSDDEALSLFQEKALKSKDTPENIKRLAISISKECKGLPIAIVAVASSLKGKQEVLWHAALNKLRSSKPINISMGLPNPYMCLKLSYDNLDTEEARSLFLLCSVFPEDYEIPVECLIRCAIGLGVARVVETYEATRIELTEPKIKLVSSCLLLEADDKHVKMHDLVRDVAHGIAKNENKIIKCEVEKDVSLEQGSFSLSNLEFLEIYSCSMLDSLFTTSVAKTLTSLEELEICICDGLKHVVTPERVKKNKKENMVEDKHEFKSDLSMFSSLKRVTIWHCNSMQDIFAMPFVGGVVNIQNHFPTHQTLSMSNANNGDWMMGQQVSLKLEYLNLFGLPKMTRIWVNTNNSFTLQHLNSLIIKECEKLEVIFPQFMLQSLPDLSHIRLRKCEELRQIIEEDLEDKRFIQPCFPKLQSLFIEECHKLKCFASVSASNDLSNLKILIIKEATELQEFIACEYDETGKTKVQLPQLKVIIFMHLSNFHQETIFSNVKHRIIRNCPKLSLTSTTTPQELQQNLHLEGLGNSKIYRRVISQLMYEIEKLDEVSTNNNSTEVPSSQIKEESDKKFIEKDYGSKEVAPATSINLEVDGKSNCETYSQELVGAKSTTGSYLTDQQNPLGQTQSTVKMTSDPQAMEQNFPVISSPNMTQRTHQTEANNIGKTTTSDKLAIPTSALENIEEIGRQRTKDGPLSEEAAIKTPSTDIRTRLEECKHFADLNDSRISLLVEAISAYPHLWKACEKFSDRFQALMLKTLTDMLLFLRSESVGSVNPDKEKEFLKLCDEAVQLGFEKSWVDEMRQRVVGRDSKLDHAKTRIGDLLKRHAHLTQELNNMKIELVSLHDYFDVPTKCFDFL